jgi:hypothetical protein
MLDFLFPDFQRFQIFVRNCLRNTLKWYLHPFQYGIPDYESQVRRIEICSNFQMECIDEGLDPVLEENIHFAINEKKLPRLISLGSRGMNSDYILFFHGLHIYYTQQCAELCCEGRSGRKATSDLKKLWFNEGYVLPDSI